MLFLLNVPLPLPDEQETHKTYTRKKTPIAQFMDSCLSRSLSHSVKGLV